MLQNILAILAAVAVVGLVGVYFYDGIWEQIFAYPAAIAIVILAILTGGWIVANRR